MTASRLTGTAPTRFVSLPMYDLPELRSATDALWDDIAARLGPLVDGVPAQLQREGDDLARDHWRHPGLLLSQSCGWPVATTLSGSVAVVGAFSYRGVSDSMAHFASHLVVRSDDIDRPLDGRDVAVNGTDSLTGWISLRSTIREPGAVLVTGSHAESLDAVRDGRADLAAIDPVCWALLANHRPAVLAGLTVVGSGPRVPCLPLITHPSLTPGVDALRDVMADVRSGPLLIDGFVALGAADYTEVLELG